MIQIYTYEFFCIHVHEYMYEYKWILFNGWVIFHSVYVPQLRYPFVYLRASRLLPYSRRMDKDMEASLGIFKTLLSASEFGYPLC